MNFFFAPPIRRRLINSLVAIALLVSTGWLLSGRWEEASMFLKCRGIRNDDVAADVTYFGLQWKYRGITEKIVESKDRRYVRHLLNCLADPDQQIAAHFALVDLTAKHDESDMEMLGFLRPKIDKGVSFDPDERAMLQVRWKARLGL